MATALNFIIARIRPSPVGLGIITAMATVAAVTALPALVTI